MHVKFYPYEKGGGGVLAMLKRGGKAWHIEAGSNI